MKVLDLCSGIGGFSLGLERAGMETVAFCEVDKKCRKILKKHWPDVPIFNDIYDLKGDEFEQPRLICAGMPCQPFSVAGIRLGKDDDRYVWPEVFRLVEAIKPDWCVFENVVGLLNMGIEIMLADLESAGYSFQVFNIPACAVDAPHERQRIFIIANSNREGLEGRQEAINTERQRQWTLGSCDSLAVPRRGWLPGTGIRGVDDGISRRMYRIKMLGNSIVPQLVEVLGRAILATEILCSEEIS